jgi:hypothetical protein
LPPLIENPDLITSNVSLEQDEKDKTADAAKTGAMAAFHMPCANATTCGGGPPKLPAGRACSQSATKGFKFCDTSLSLDARVTDFVERITLVRKGYTRTYQQADHLRQHA